PARWRWSAGAGLHERLLDIGSEELRPAACRAALRGRRVVHRGPARLAAEMPVPARLGDDRGGLGEQLADLAELVRHAQRLDPRARLIGLDETVHERVKT